MLKKKQKEKPAESEVERVRHSLFTYTCSAQTTIWDICPMIIHDYIFRLGLDKGADATIVIFEGTCIQGGGANVLHSRRLARAFRLPLDINLTARKSRSSA